MILVAFLVAGISIFILYDVVIQEKKEYLKELSENQTGIIKSLYESGKGGDEVVRILKQQRKINLSLGLAGEFVIGYLKNDSVFFLLDHLEAGFVKFGPIAINSKPAAPMKLALQKKTGFIRGLDYRSNKVLAYYTHIPELDWGIVTKIDIAEVNRPFHKAGLYAGLFSVLLVISGTLIFNRFSDPIIDNLFRNNEKIRAILDVAQESIYMLDRQGIFQIVNQTGAERFSLKPADMTGRHFSEFMTPELAMSRKEQLDRVFTTGIPVKFEDIRSGIYFEHHFFPCFIKREVRFVATYSRDITEAKRKEQQLLRLNRILKALEKSSKAMLKAGDEISYLNEVCRIVVDDCKFSMVWIGFARNNEAKTVEPIVFSGFDKGYLETLNITWEDNPRGRGPTGTAIRTGKIAVCRNMDTDPAFAPWRAEALKRGYRSSIVIPLLDKDLAFGAINIYSGEPDSFTGQEVEFLTELAADLSYGIVSLRMKAAQATAEEELRQSEQRLKYHFENSPLAIIEWDSNFIVTKWSDKAERIFGWMAEETVGKRIDSLNMIYEEDLPIVAVTMKRLGSGKENVVVSSNRNYRKSGEVIHCTWYNSVLYNERGEMSSVMSLIDDYTERKKAEESLRESEEKLKLALQNGSIGVWVWDIRTNAIEWDERMERIFGIEPGNFGKSYAAFESCLVEEDIPHVRLALKQALEKDVPFQTVYRIIYGKNETKYISAKAMVNRDASGIPVKMTGVCYDVTEMKKDTEQTLFSLNDELLRSNKELEQFAYVASHDLQEPLRMVSSFTQLLAMRYSDKLDKDAKEFIQYAVEGASHMQKLINDLLAYSRIQTRGKEFTPVDMNEVLGKALFNLGAKIKEINALVSNDELPVLFADEGQMVQLFQNLIGNAVKFSVKSPIIHISVTEEKEHFVFSVKDNGIGIEKQYFERIFQIFQKLHPRDEFEGTGIGLAVCRRIIERHGGKIWVESEKDRGSAFYFTLNKNKQHRI